MAAKSLIAQPIYARVLSHFPQNFTFCFAYGSGVKQQLKNKASTNMIDMIFCVDNPFRWHSANIRANNSHYSALKYLGPNFIAKFQENSGAKVYFNTLVPLEDVLIKYGVVSTKDLVTDLLEWSHLYLAGRLHKPVEIIKRCTSSELQTALQINLQCAVHAALLILPDSFNEFEFYYTISNLSYGGDFRMTFGENKNKVRNIVVPQLADFRRLYKPIIQNLKEYIEFPVLNLKEEEIFEDVANAKAFTDEKYRCFQDVSPMAKLHHLNQLPRWPQKALTRIWNRGNFKQDTEDVLRAIAYDPDSDAVVEQCINEIVWNSSVKQSLKGILTAGVMKSVKYSGQKIAKMLH